MFFSCHARCALLIKMSIFYSFFTVGCHYLEEYCEAYVISHLETHSQATKLNLFLVLSIVFGSEI